MNFEDFENQELVQRIFIYRSNFGISADEPAVEVQTGRRSQGVA